MSVVGARPQFIKLAAIADACQGRSEIDHVIVHTGQHYDRALSDVFFDEFEIPTPNVHLEVGSASHGVQTGTMLAKLDPVLLHYKPDCVLVYGDTNSTIAAALGAVKLHIPVAHLEAGLRSFNREMPEEHNRVLVDHAADLLLAPTDVAVNHLTREGLRDRTVLVGDVMTDVCLRVRDQLEADRECGAHSVVWPGPYVVATIHRAENTDNADRLANVLAALREIATPVHLIVHPRLRDRAECFGLRLDGGALHAAEPLNYGAMIRAVLGSAGVVTDSGGLQKEAYLLGVPCTTLRSETEWVETLSDGWNVLDEDLMLVRKTAIRSQPVGARPAYYGDGHAASRVLDAIMRMTLSNPRRN